MRSIVMGLLAGALFAGCATGGANRAAMQAEFNSTIPTCDSKEACDAMWEAAQLWIAKNSRLKIQTATNVLIETYGGGQNSAVLAMRATKEPAGGGKSRIVFDGGCNNMFGCVPNVFEAGIRFNRAVAATAQASP